MTRSDVQVRELIAQLRARGGDFTEVEVKRASGGNPILGPTLSAFGNMPEGGTIVLGLDESAGFTATGVDDPRAVEQAVASQARQSVKPPVQISFQTVRVDGVPILIADVTGLPRGARPCTFEGRAYLRQADGDYELSPHELQQIERSKLSGIEHPRDDARAVAGSSRSDLDPDILAGFLSDVRASSPRLSVMDETAVLRAKAVLEPHGDRLTVAGLVALGRYPQQFFPSYAITAAVQLPPGSGARTRDLVHMDGPIPDLLDRALEWVRRNTTTRIRYDQRGHARDELEFPALAIRELIANALVHRDLSPLTEGKRVEIRITDDNLIISNPGGLRGITVRQLGDVMGKSAVNQFLYDIAKFTRVRDGARVIEGEGGGIREVRAALDAAGMQAPVFYDTGVAFIARVPRHALIGADDLRWLTEVASSLPISDLQRRILVRFRHGGELTNSDVRREFRIADPAECRMALQGLADTGLVEVQGSGRGTRYRLVGPSLIARDVIHVEVEDSTVTAESVQSTPVRTNSKVRPSVHQPKILQALTLPLTFSEIVSRTGLTTGQARFALSRMMDLGTVRMLGGQGQRDTKYARASAGPNAD